MDLKLLIQLICLEKGKEGVQGVERLVQVFLCQLWSCLIGSVLDVQDLVFLSNIYFRGCVLKEKFFLISIKISVRLVIGEGLVIRDRQCQVN